MKSQHVHTWGAKGRPPHTGDLCLACPQTWTPRAAGYHTDNYKPRTKPQRTPIAAGETCYNQAKNDPGDVDGVNRGLDDLTGGHRDAG